MPEHLVDRHRYRHPNQPSSPPGRRRCLTLAISAALALSLNNGATAQVFPAEINLGDPNGDNGEIFTGEAEGGNFGRSVSAAGDINGDGIDDLIIGAKRADPPFRYHAGIAYVVYGRGDTLFGDRFEGE